jgi:hypothetical protein
MKNTWKILAGLLMVTGLVYYSGCVKGDFDEPPIYVPTVDFEANTSIAALKASFTTFRQIEEDIVIEGVVVANDEAGNLFKKLVIQDETAGIELSLDRYNLYNQFKLGQRVLVKCQGMYIGHYNNLMQLGYTFNDDIGRLPEPLIDQHVFRDSLAGAKPEPKEITLGSLTDLTNDNLARLDSAVSTLVRFKDVRFTDADAGQPWVKPDEDNTNRTIIDGSNNSLIIRTSRFSNFAYESTPYGFGEITGVLSVFRTTWQLTIRDLDDVNDFTGIIPDPPGGGTGTFEDPFDVVRAITDNSGSGVWVEGYIVGVFETDVSPFEPNYSAPFRTNSNLLIAPSADVTSIANCLTVQLPVGAVRTALNLVDNPDNKSKSVKIYGDLETYFSQAGLKNATGYWMDGDGIIPGGGGGSGTGSGTKEDPFDVTSAIEQQNENPYVIGWVKGYIVGSVKAGTSSIGSSGDIDFSAPFSSATNVLLAENASVTDYMNCVVVNLPAGTPLRSQVNLLDNPDNLGKELNVNGTLRTYFGIAGLRDSNGTTADFELEDNGGGGGGTFIFQEVFAADLGVFTAFSVAGAQAWGWGSFDGGCAVMSGYDQGTNYANEDWLVSPAISLAGESGVVLNIREAINYITSYDDMQVLISTDYDGSSDPSTNGTWTEQSEFNRPAGNSWTFVDSGDISLAAYEGQTIYIAFKYLSTSDGSATWEISRVEVK